jgi:hypothetical protein
MENMDVVDKHTPTGGDIIDLVPPPVWGGHYGYLQELTYTEKVRGSSPFAPTKTPPPVGVFALLSL